MLLSYVLHANVVQNEFNSMLKFHAYIIALVFSGFLEAEIKKDSIPMLDTGENPDAPLPREMIDLEVSTAYIYSWFFIIHFRITRKFGTNKILKKYFLGTSSFYSNLFQHTGVLNTPVCHPLQKGSSGISCVSSLRFDDNFKCWQSFFCFNIGGTRI